MIREEQMHYLPPQAPVSRPIKFKVQESSKSQHQGANASLMRHYQGLEESRPKRPSNKVSVLKFLSIQKPKSQTKTVKL